MKRGTVKVRGRRYDWRAGILRKHWVVGVRYELAPDSWLWSLGPLCLMVGRTT